MVRRTFKVGGLCLIAGVLLASNAVGAAHADAFDPSTLCPSASPSATDLDAVYAALTTTDQGSSTGFTGQKTTHFGSESLQTSYTYDKADSRGSLRVALGSEVVSRAIVDRAASQVYELVSHHSGAVFEDAQYNVGLSELKVHSAWVSMHQSLTGNDLLTAGGNWTDLAQVPAGGPFGDAGKLDTKATYTCSVAGDTQSVSDGTNSWQMTVDDQGRAVSVQVDGNDPGLGTYTQSASATYDGANLVSRPHAISSTTLDKAIVRGFVKKLKPEITASAKARFKKDHTHATRVTSLRNAAKAKANAMLKKYADGGEMKISRTKIKNGVKVTFTYRDPEFQTHASGHVNLRVKAKHVTAAYYLPKI